MSSCVVVVVAMVAAINLALPKLSASDLHPSSTQLLWTRFTDAMATGFRVVAVVVVIAAVAVAHRGSANASIG